MEVNINKIINTSSDINDIFLILKDQLLNKIINLIGRCCKNFNANNTVKITKLTFKVNSFFGKIMIDDNLYKFIVDEENVEGILLNSKLKSVMELYTSIMISYYKEIKHKKSIKEKCALIKNNWKSSNLSVLLDINIIEKILNYVLFAEMYKNLLFNSPDNEWFYPDCKKLLKRFVLVFSYEICNLRDGLFNDDCWKCLEDCDNNEDTLNIYIEKF